MSEALPSSDRIYNHLVETGRAMTPRQVSEELHISYKTVREALGYLKKSGAVVSAKHHDGTLFSVNKNGKQRAPQWYYVLLCINGDASTVSSIMYALNRSYQWVVDAMEYLEDHEYIKKQGNWYELTGRGQDETMKDYIVDPVMMKAITKANDAGIRRASVVMDDAVRQARRMSRAEAGNYRKRRRQKDANRERAIHILRDMFGCETMQDLDAVLGYSRSYICKVANGGNSMVNAMLRACFELDMSPNALAKKMGVTKEQVFK